MPLAQTWMTALVDVALRAAESIHEKISQPLLGAGQIVLRIHGPQDLVGRHLHVKRVDEPVEAILADNRKNLIKFHGSRVPMFQGSKLARQCRSMPPEPVELWNFGTLELWNLGYDLPMDESPKSAIELAMERLRKRDEEQGVSERSLSDDQKAEIASVRQNYSAKLAQEDILFKSRLATVFEHEERLKLEEGHRREMQRLNEERDRKIEKIRNSNL
jgi:hypothetical protein